jgi:Mg2+ and Co2+ transporter CorA
MNVSLPFDNKHWLPFWGIMTLAGASVFGFWLFLKKAKW